MPAHAKQISENVYFLGKANHNGKIAEGYAIVHPRNAYGKPGTSCGNNICEPGENAKKCAADCSGDTGGDDSSTAGCYSFLAKGAKWKGTPEPWTANTSNTRNLNESVIFDLLNPSVSTWEDAAGQDILGIGTTTSSVLDADTDSPDGANEVYFADITNNDAIGITIV